MATAPEDKTPASLTSRAVANGQVTPQSEISGSARGKRFMPPANPFDVSGPYAATMRLALSMALLPGLGTGLLLVLVVGLRLPLAIAWPQLAQGHGQVQALGFVLLFIIAVGLQLLPRFLGAPLLHAHRAAWGAVGVALATVTRLVAQPLT